MVLLQLVQKAKEYGYNKDWQTLLFYTAALHKSFTTDTTMQLVVVGMRSAKASWVFPTPQTKHQSRPDGVLVHAH
jgi:hypothetical protein